jgi:hypothetical protein
MMSPRFSASCVLRDGEGDVIHVQRVAVREMKSDGVMNGVSECGQPSDRLHSSVPGWPQRINPCAASCGGVN